MSCIMATVKDTFGIYLILAILAEKAKSAKIKVHQYLIFDTLNMHSFNGAQING